MIEELVFRYPLLLARNIDWLWVLILLVWSTWIFGVRHWLTPRYITVNPKQIRSELDSDPVYKKLGSQYISLEDAVALYRSRVRGRDGYADTHTKILKLGRVYVGSAVVLGFVLGVIVLVTGNILPAIAIHALVNLAMKWGILSTKY